MAPLFRIASLAVLLTLGVGALSCSSDHDHAHDHQQGTSPAAGRAVVEWPALRELDEQSHHLEAELAEGHLDHARAMAPGFRAAALAVATQQPPANVRNLVQVELLQMDLENLAESVADLDAVGDEDLAMLLSSFHPIIAQLMTAAGLPHTHGGHAHDHSGHDHAHD